MESRAIFRVDVGFYVQSLYYVLWALLEFLTSRNNTYVCISIYILCAYMYVYIGMYCVRIYMYMYIYIYDL